MSDNPAPPGNTQGFPNNVISFTQPGNGLLTAAAYRFLLSIWQRTGGSGGGGGFLQVNGIQLMDDMADAAPLSASALLLTDEPAPAETEANAAMTAEMATVQDAPKTYPGLWAMVITDEGP